jgi:hypothetical protein
MASSWVALAAVAVLSVLAAAGYLAWAALGSQQSSTPRRGQADRGDALQRDMHMRVVNNLFVRPVYGVGETCQFSPADGFGFEQNTLVDAQGCNWGSDEGQDWPNAENYSTKRNLLSGDSGLSCNDTTAANSCTAFKAGTSGNRSGWSRWRDTTWYEPVGLPADLGARLGPGDFQGFPLGPRTRRSGP